MANMRKTQKFKANSKKLYIEIKKLRAQLLLLKQIKNGKRFNTKTD
jgi:hypothetical protein